MNEIMQKLESIEKMALLGAKNVLDIDDACLLTGMSKGHLYKLTSNRGIPHYKNGRKLYFKREELEKWMLDERVKTNEEIDREATTYITLKSKMNAR